DDSDLGFQIGPPRLLPLADRQYERVAQHDANAGDAFERPVEQAAVLALEHGGGCRVVIIEGTPRIVDADHNRHPGRLHLNALHIPTLEQVLIAVAADALIAKSDAALLIPGVEPPRGDHGIT